MESYDLSSRMHRWMEEDEGDTKRNSWLKQLPTVPEELMGKEHYKLHYKEGFMENTEKTALEHAGRPRVRGRTDCRYHYVFLERDQDEFYLYLDLTRTQREVLFAFRGSSMGLAHNHEWLYNGNRSCPLCDNATDDEEHLLLQCALLRSE
jgi:hypothetical protein